MLLKSLLRRRLEEGISTEASKRDYRKDFAMARAGSHILDAGERLPVVTMDTIAHGRISVPEHFGDGWGVFLIYRAHW